MDSDPLAILAIFDPQKVEAWFEWGGYFVTTPDYQHIALPR